MATNPLAFLALRQPRFRLAGAPVFLYHGLAVSPEAGVPRGERKYWVFKTQLLDHLNQAREEGCRISLLRELWDHREKIHTGQPPVALTFDDGRVSGYQIAYPLLLEACVRADFFVNTSTVGGDGFLNWEQISEMQRSGMSFQSHSHDHVDLLRLSPGALERQLRDSRRRLEDRLGCAVEFLSAPYGRLNGRVVATAQQAGYRAVCSSRSWPARPGAPTVPRVAVYAHTSRREFRALLRRNPFPYAARALRLACVYLPQRLLLRLWPAQLGVRVLEEKA